MYCHDGSQVTIDTFSIMVTDGNHTSSARVPVIVGLINDEAPRVTVNRGLRVFPGQCYAMFYGMLIVNNGNHSTCVNVSDILQTHKNSLHFLKLHCLVSSKVLYLIFYICDDFQTHKNTLYFLKLHCLVNLLDSYYKMLYNGKEGMIKKTKTICWTYEHNSGTRMQFPVVQDDITCMDQSNNYFFTFAMISFLASRFHS